MKYPELKCLRFLLVVVSFSVLMSSTWGQSSPVINVWYGKEQTFGKTGVVQRWVNVLGNVDPEREIAKLDFALNDGNFQRLSMGPDLRRLQRAGDFNIELPVEQLRPGENTVLIEAVDKNGELYSETITLIWAPEYTQPDYLIDWSTVDQLGDVAQPIDGLWRIEGDNLVSAPEAVGYDRVIGFGDVSWTDYEVLVPFQILNTDPSSFETVESQGPALLVLHRWQGHTDSPIRCPQPHCGWEPYGATFSYAFDKEGGSEGTLATNWFDDLSDSPELTLEVGKKYWIRIRGETTVMGNLFSVKIWEGGEANEPDDWSAQTLGGSLNLTRGSFLMVAHHIDLAIGTMQFIPIGTMRNKIVNLITESADVLVQLPYLILWIIGILWALAYMRRDPARGRWILVSFILLFITNLIGFLLIQYVPEYLQNHGWITRRLSYVYLLIHGIPIGGHILAWAILFKTLFPTKPTD